MNDHYLTIDPNREYKKLFTNPIQTHVYKHGFEWVRIHISKYMKKRDLYIILVIFFKKKKLTNKTQN